MIPMQQLLFEIKETNNRYEKLLDEKIGAINEINKALEVAISTEQKINLLVEKDRINREIEHLTSDNSGEISKIRYIKGLQIIKLLYEKVLSLDHHFASVRTLNEINKMSNPNQYPEYEKLKEVVSTKKDKKLLLNYPLY